MNLSSSVLKTLLDQFDVWGEATVDDDGLITVHGTVTFSPITPTSTLPVKFRLVTGTFNCSDTGLTTLDGCPQEVGDNFFCNDNRLSSMQGAPKVVGGDLEVAHNPLISLDGAPATLGGRFLVSYDPSLPLLRTLVARVLYLKPRMGTGRLSQAAENTLLKHAGVGRKGAFSAARALIKEGERLQDLYHMPHNPFEANARW